MERMLPAIRPCTSQHDGIRTRSHSEKAFQDLLFSIAAAINIIVPTKMKARPGIHPMNGMNKSSIPKAVMEIAKNFTRPLLGKTRLSNAKLRTDPFTYKFCYSVLPRLPTASRAD